MSQTYFQQLNYSMANEDTTLEYQLAQSRGAKKILTVGGSGSRSLPFLALPLDSLQIVDVSADQLLLINLKLETIKQLSRADAIAFWTEGDGKKREEIFKKLRLDERLVAFFKFHHQSQREVAPLYWGKWEKTFRTFSRLTRLLFSEEILRGVFEAPEPYAHYQKYIKGLKWDLLLKIVGNKAMFNSLLYKGSFIRKNSPLSYFSYYSQAFERLFHLEVKKSHFLQLCLLGKVVKEEGLPIEFSPELFEQIKRSTVKPSYHQGSIFQRPEETQYDFISLSDVPSYLSGELEQDYILHLSNNLSPKGLIVNRFYLRKTEGTRLQGFKDITSQYQEMISRELVQMYEVQLLEKV